ncbi:aminoglycoside phosphotransferase family protein [Oceanobacillus sp. CAU 1775]
MLEQIISNFKLQVQAITPVEDSHSSTVYKCHLQSGDCVFIKIPYTKLKYHRELEAYEILRGKVAIPRLIDYWAGDSSCPGAFLLSELKGEPLSTNVSPEVAYEVGILHASIHNVAPRNVEVLTGIKNEFVNWSTFVEKQFYSFAEDVKGVLNKELYDKAIVKYEDMKSQLPSPDGPSFIHMDFRPANIIIAGTQVSGVIDFESVRFGSTEVDFTKLHRDFLSFNQAFYLAYQEGYKSVRSLIDLDAVLPFYQFTDAFNSIGWCKRRGMEKHALFLEENLVRLEQMLL